MKQPKASHSHVVDPSKDHHFINGQLVPVPATDKREARAAIAKSRRKAAEKPKGVEGRKSPEAGG